MADDRGVRQGRERLLLTKGALRMRVLDARAHPALPFVFAGGDVADAAVFPAESVRMDVGPSFEERPEQRNLLVRRALRCDEAARPRGFVDRGGGFEPEPLFDVALLGFGGVAACASANDCGVAAGRRDRLDRLDRDIELVVEKRVLRERLLHGLAFRFAWSLTLGEGVVGGMIPRGAPRRCCATPVSVPVFSGFLRASRSRAMVRVETVRNLRKNHTASSWPPGGDSHFHGAPRGGFWLVRFFWGRK